MYILRELSPQSFSSATHGSLAGYIQQVIQTLPACWTVAEGSASTTRVLFTHSHPLDKVRNGTKSTRYSYYISQSGWGNGFPDGTFSCVSMGLPDPYFRGVTFVA